MKSIFLALGCLTVATSNLLAQASPATSKPRVAVTVFSDGKPVNQQTGLKADAKEIRFKALLDTSTNGPFTAFKPALVIKNKEAFFVRNGRQIAQLTVTDKELPPAFFQEAQPDDHIVFKLTLVAQRTNGELVPLPEQPIYKFTIRK
ncbi:hypothetical protein [Fibrella aestuarina]|uniref:hypothetical protein n=1 Tax=Fibrella aestuarina TaxID=651143 RepID=UPI00059BDD04|nr:hypothetical protein [Fibrella aestuarina]